MQIEDDWEFPIWDFDDESVWRQYSATGRWLYRTCTNSETDATIEGLLPEGGEVDPEALAAEALRSVSIPDPEIGTAPAPDRLVVRVPTWLWIEDGWWSPYTATATAGRVSATVTAQPTRVMWETGDGESKTCSGPGVPWRPGLAEDATDCSYPYTSSSRTQPDGTYELTAAVELTVNWTANTGEGDTLPAISRSSSVAVTVEEIQALETE